MTVVRINEKCHGFIGIAKDYVSAQNYVIDYWLRGDLYVYVDDKEQTIKEAFGENWKEALKELPFIIFEDLMNDQFWFYEEDLIGSEDE